MSNEFEENPFADPKTVSQTPASSAIAVAPTSNNDQAGGANFLPSSAATMDSYDPFKGSMQTGNLIDGSPARMNANDATSGNSSGGAGKTAQQSLAAEELKRRQDELDRRAQELDKRERELRSGNFNPRAHNWPPLPSLLGIQPCFYLDISVDIPVEFQRIVRYIYYLWIGYVALLLSNLLIGLLYMFIGGGGITTFFMALFYLIILTPASFMCWFRPAYKAFRDDSSLNFMIFFFVFFFQIIVATVYALGIGGNGSCGLIHALTLFGKDGGSTFIGILMVMSSIGYASFAAASTYMLLKVHGLYKSSGASLSKAQAEFTAGVMSNDGVRQAAADAAAATAQSAFGTPGQAAANGSSGGRF